MTNYIIDILAYGMTGLVVSSIGCIMFDVDLKYFKYIVTTFTFACILKRTFDYI